MKKKLPSPDEFPITFEHVLRLAVGGRDVPERFRIFRAWWRSQLVRMSHISGVVVDNTDEAVKYFRDVGVDSGWFNHKRIGICDYKEAQKSASRREAAMARWNKQKARMQNDSPPPGE